MGYWALLGEYPSICAFKPAQRRCEQSMGTALLISVVPSHRSCRSRHYGQNMLSRGKRHDRLGTGLRSGGHGRRSVDQIVYCSSSVAIWPHSRVARYSDFCVCILYIPWESLIATIALFLAFYRIDGRIQPHDLRRLHIRHSRGITLSPPTNSAEQTQTVGSDQLTDIAIQTSVPFSSY